MYWRLPRTLHLENAELVDSVMICRKYAVQLSLFERRGLRLFLCAGAYHAIGDWGMMTT